MRVVSVRGVSRSRRLQFRLSLDCQLSALSVSIKPASRLVKIQNLSLSAWSWKVPELSGYRLEWDPKMSPNPGMEDVSTEGVANAIFFLAARVDQTRRLTGGGGGGGGNRVP